MHYCTECKSILDQTAIPLACPVCGVKWIYEHPRTPEENQGRALGGTSSTQAQACTEEGSYQEALAQEAASEDHYHSLLTDWVIGYRHWTLRDSQLWGEFQASYAWKKGLLQTQVNDFGETGFYAYHAIDDMEYGGGNKDHRTAWSIAGAIKAKGDIYIGEERFRAEYAQVIVLCYSEDWKYKDVMQFKRWAALNYAAKTTTLAKLRITALQFGSEVPESIRPTYQDKDDDEY